MKYEIHFKKPMVYTFQKGDKIIVSEDKKDAFSIFAEVNQIAETEIKSEKKPEIDKKAGYKIDQKN